MTINLIPLEDLAQLVVDRGIETHHLLDPDDAINGRHLVQADFEQLSAIAFVSKYRFLVDPDHAPVSVETSTNYDIDSMTGSESDWLYALGMVHPTNHVVRISGNPNAVVKSFVSSTLVGAYYPDTSMGWHHRK